MLTPEQVMSLLALASVVDNRKPPTDDIQKRALIETWLAAVGDYTYEDCVAAIRKHYNTTTEWLMPKHVIDGVRAIHAERQRAYGPLPAPVHLDALALSDPAEHGRQYRAYYAETGKLIRDGILKPGTPPPGLEDMAPQLLPARPVAALGTVGQRIPPRSSPAEPQGDSVRRWIEQRVGALDETEEQLVTDMLKDGRNRVAIVNAITRRRAA